MGVTVVLDMDICATAPQEAYDLAYNFRFSVGGSYRKRHYGFNIPHGKTILENAAREPEIQDLANFLISGG